MASCVVYCCWIIVSVVSLKSPLIQARLFPCLAASTVIADRSTLLIGPVDNYAKIEDCWVVNTSQNEVILVEVLNVTILPWVNSYLCDQQYLAVYEGTSNDDYDNKGLFCQSRREPWTYKSTKECCTVIKYFKARQNRTNHEVPFYIRLTPTKKETSYAVVGYVVGAVIFILVLILVVVVCRYKRRQSAAAASAGQDSNQNVVATQDRGQGTRVWMSDIIGSVNLQEALRGQNDDESSVYQPPPLYSELSVRDDTPVGYAGSTAAETGSSREPVDAGVTLNDHAMNHSPPPNVSEPGRPSPSRLSTLDGAADTSVGQLVSARPAAGHVSAVAWTSSSEPGLRRRHRSAEAACPTTPPPVYDDTSRSAFPSIPDARGRLHTAGPARSPDNHDVSVGAPAAAGGARIGAGAVRSEENRRRRHSGTSFPITPPPVYDESMLFRYPPGPSPCPSPVVRGRTRGPQVTD